MAENNEALTKEEIEAIRDSLPQNVEIVGVRFKTSGKIYFFSPNGLNLCKNDNVIVKTARGLEFGTVAISNRSEDKNKLILPLRDVVRKATKIDIEQHEANVQSEKEAFAICEEQIASHNLEMKLVDVEYTFDNNKLLFYFTAEGRVDFRGLVKDLASVFKTRIELRQIGIRDETKLIGGLGVCGREFCCKKFLPDFMQVSIKMAKEQNLSLNSAKISGVCGKLMCCLRYEHEVYEEAIKKMPKLDSEIQTPDGVGVVIETNPLAELIRVRLVDDNLVKLYNINDMSKEIKPKSRFDAELSEFNNVEETVQDKGNLKNNNSKNNKQVVNPQKKRHNQKEDAQPKNVFDKNEMKSDNKLHRNKDQKHFKKKTKHSKEKEDVKSEN